MLNLSLLGHTGMTASDIFSEAQTCILPFDTISICQKTEADNRGADKSACVS